MKMFCRASILIVFMLFLSGVGSSAYAGTGPETMNLKERFHVKGNKKAVIFPHHRHQAKLQCTKCHKTMAGGELKLEIEKKKGFGNDFHRKFCWPCHVKMRVPKGKACNTCHK